MRRGRERKDRQPARRVRCAQCRVLTKAEYLDEAGLCECCRLQPGLFTLPGGDEP